MVGAASLALVVDDEPAICDMVSEHLARLGLCALTTTDTGEGLDLARLHRPALIVLGAADACSALAQLRTDPATCDTPALILTGQPGEGTPSGGTEQQLAKPFTVPVLADAVRRLVEQLRRPGRRAIPE